MFMHIHSLKKTSMATNKFATMLHNNTHKIIVILVYAILEWILILLLLLNSLFSFSIGKFVKHFGLKPPCTYCSTINHLFESENQEHICEEHGTMISKLSYCSTHHRLNESKSNNLCFNCSFFTLENEKNKEEEVNKCCCCDEILSSKSLHPFQLPFKDSWDFLDYIQKKTSVLELIDEENREENVLKHKLKSEDITCELSDDLFENPLCNIDDDDDNLYVTETLLENAEYMDSDKFICIELISRSEDIMEEMDNFTDSERENKIPRTETKASNYEQDSCDQVVETTIIPFCSSADLYVTDCISIEVSEDQESNGKSKELEESRKDDPLSEMEIDDESLTLDHLKAALKAREKTLSALYTELEEERKASTISTNETMSMITKLQEEKSAMQMEAHQYQRMMEEQAEYDQEALQLLNDLMIKREKEKQELEKELQIYREKVMDYEARDMITMRSKKGSLNSTSSLDSSHSKLNDELQIGPNCSYEEKEVEFSTQMSIPDISLEEFDEERLCILEELKALEAKLFTLPLDNSCLDMAKKLLPLFDATDNEFDKGGDTYNDHLEKNNEICIEDELGNMHERLQALEEDKEFLKHCMSSMMKGNKGLILLQEILQHLRDLRSVELSYNKCVIE